MTIDPNILNELATVLNSDAGKELTLPTSHELGQLMGDVANIARFYATVNLGNLFTQWREYRTAIGRFLTAGDIAKTLPLLQPAAMASDEDLQGRWVNLLESVANDDPSYMPSFASTLAVLTPEEAKFLDRLYAIGMQPRKFNTYPPGIVPMSEEALVKAFDSSINSFVTASEVNVYRSRMSLEKLENYERLMHCRTVIEDLVGLKLVGVTEHYALVEDKLSGGGQDVGKRTSYALSNYGVAFIRAVSSKEKFPRPVKA